MSAKLISGKEVSNEIRDKIRGEIEQLSPGQIPPKLVVVLVGEDPASAIYVRNKEKACAAVGIKSETIRLAKDVMPEKLEEVILTLNAENGVHGILVQLPLPKHIDERKILAAISPDKDVDGLHVVNMGKFFSGEQPLFLPCTPQGILELIKRTGVKIEGLNAVVIGRSNIVGKPAGMMLLKENATVTFCHSRTKNIGEITKRADILVVAIGKPKFVKKDMVKPNSIVIDVGTSRVGGKLIGDVDFDGAKEVAGFITPVPGGVGPMTITMLLRNTLLAWKRKIRKAD